MLYSNYV